MILLLFLQEIPQPILYNIQKKIMKIDHFATKTTLLDLCPVKVS
jgi:hypothetical protein